MLHRENRDLQKTAQSSISQPPLEDSIASYALASKTATEHAAKIARVREGMVPVEKLDLLETEANECLKHVMPTTLREQIFTAFSSFSQRQEALIARVVDTRNQLRHSKLMNATHELQAAMVVEGTYQEIFSSNRALFRSRYLLSACNVLIEAHEYSWSRHYDAKNLLESGARAHFELHGMKKESNGWIPEENYWAIKDAQNVILTKARKGESASLCSLQLHIMDLIPHLHWLNDAAITSADGKIAIPCNLGAEAMQRTARELDEQRGLFTSGSRDPNELIKVQNRLSQLTTDFKRFTWAALEEIENTETMIRRCIQKAIFPEIKELLRLEQLYPEDRVRALQAQLSDYR